MGDYLQMRVMKLNSLVRTAFASITHYDVTVTTTAKTILTNRTVSVNKNFYYFL